jgi:predicted metal-dependent hydrolase
MVKRCIDQKTYYLSKMRVNQRVREGQKLIEEQQQQFMNRPESHVRTQINGRFITFALPTKDISVHQSKRNSVRKFKVAKSETKLRMQNRLDRDDRRELAQSSRDYESGSRSSKHLEPPRLSEVSPADFPNLDKK